MNVVFLASVVIGLASEAAAFVFQQDFLPDLQKGGVHWTLLVAGSNTWDNYRHQADVCHAYQVLHSHGIPDERIVVIMYDDIANNERNPTPGTVINKPYGKDVYHGIPKDYTGENVNPQVFLSVLQGDEEGLRGTGSGKVIKSGPKDNIFVYFADHGASNLISFVDSFLYANQLNNAIMNMHQNKQYNKMVFYIEACESGSMFRGLLPADINVYATTAANSRESSYACYFDKKRETYLGDVYSVNWLENSDVANFKMETFERQFQIVRSETNTSHVMQFGDLRIAQMDLVSFQGGKRDAESEDVSQSQVFRKSPRFTKENSVSAYDVQLNILMNRLSMAKNLEEKNSLQKQLDLLTEKRQKIDKIFRHISTEATNTDAQAERVQSSHTFLTNYDCYEEVLDRLRYACPVLSKNEYVLSKFHTLANLCEEDVATEILTTTIDKACAANDIYEL